MTPPAVLSRALGHPRRQPGRALTRAARWLPLAAVGEMVADKLPGAPNRTAPPVLAGRIVSGAVVGTALARARRSRPASAALAGAAGAVASSFAMMRLRRQIGTRLGLPDAVVAVAEDVLTVGLSVSVARAALR